MESVEEQQRAPRGARVTAWTLAAGWAGLIFIASSIPRGAGIPLPGPGTDKLAHAGVFAVLGGLVALALRAEGLRRWRAAGLAAVVGLTYGALDELHQAFTPGRSMDGEDVVADAAGAALGALVGSGRVAEAAIRRWPGADEAQGDR